MQNSAIGLRRTHLTRTWVNGRYDARSVDDPGYTDTVREDFDRIADLSEAERVGPEGAHGASSSGVPLNTSRTTPRSRSVARCTRPWRRSELTAEDHFVLTLGPRNALSSKFGVATAT